MYLIKSLTFPETFYVGYTTNLKQRLEFHNSGGSVHTAKYKPWKLVMYLGFAEQAKAKEFEKYLKSQSGRAFAKKKIAVIRTGPFMSSFFKPFSRTDSSRSVV